MDDKKAALVVRHIDRMPSLSPTVAKILQVANDPTSSANDLNKVISLDPVLAAKVLKVVNSAYFGFSDEVTSTVRAIVMLGLNTIKNLALSTAAMEALTTKGSRGLDMDEFWRHLLATGVCSKLIARKIGIHKNFLEDYFLGGMMHDIGKIVLNSMNPVGYTKILAASEQSGKPLSLYESAIFGINHSEIGGILAEKWGLQAQLQQTMSLHHSLDKVDKEHQRLVYVVSVSNNYCKEVKVGFSGNTYLEPVSDDTWKVIGITKEILYDLEGFLVEGVERASIFLQSAS